MGTIGTFIVGNYNVITKVQQYLFQGQEKIIFVATNGLRYEKLPIAGDFLSSYTKVEAGYNP
jgi:hypothetical protein